MRSCTSLKLNLTPNALARQLYQTEELGLHSRQRPNLIQSEESAIDFSLQLFSSDSSLDQPFD